MFIFIINTNSSSLGTIYLYF